MKINPPVSIVLEISGVEHRLSRPKLGTVKIFESELAAANAAGSGTTAVFMAHVVRCGLPVEVLDELDSEQLLEIFVALQPAKKNT